ncbi:MAG: serine/threonine protein kinase [Planctomycetota bacterium]|nr:serine/threonine protein kinase [Planctomycetota bacterium]
MTTEPVPPKGSDAPTLRPGGGPPDSAAPSNETVSLSGGGVPSPATDPTLIGDAAKSRTAHDGQAHARKLGPYALVRLLGRGGMGAVWEAQDTRLNRRVAVKVMVAGEHASEHETERFRREAQNSAKLRHPNIVPVHDFGIEACQQYLVMDLVDGVMLADALRQRQFTYREKAIMLEKVARAVQYAHEQGVIHRDLKPSNIMLEFAKGGCSSDEVKPGSSTNVALPMNERPVGEPLVMDFGLAKDIAKDSSLSQSGQVMGTPAYMPPEQAEGRVRDVGPRSDVYSLGAILYEMLTGRVPFTGENAMQVLRATCHDDPVPPRRITPDVPRDLETLCLKCLEKEAAKRYGSAEALAEDLARWLRGEPIAARAASFTERLAKWVRRRPATAALIGVSAVALVALVGGGVWYNARLVTERDKARTAAANEKAEAERARAAEAEAAQKAREATRRLAESLALQADGHCLAGHPLESLDRYNEAQRTLASLGEPTFVVETGILELDNAYPLPLNTFSGHSNWVNSVAFSPDGKLALSGSRDKTLKLWEVKTGRELRTFSGHTSWVKSIAFSPDGKLALSGSGDKTLKLWDVRTGRELRTFSGHTDSITSVAFAPDGALVLSATFDGVLKLMDVGTGRELRTFSGGNDQSLCVAFSADGKLALAGGMYHRLRLRDLATGRELRTLSGHIGQVSSIALSPDAKFALSGSNDMTLRLWDVTAERELRTFGGDARDVKSVAFAPGGKSALSGSRDGMLKLWDVATGRELRSYSGHADSISSVAFSPDGKLALSGSDDNTLKLWDVSMRGELRTFDGGTDKVWSIAFSPDGKLTLSGSGDRMPRLWDAVTGLELRRFSGHTSCILSVAFSPDGKLALSGSGDKTLKLWEVKTGRELRTFSGHRHQVSSVAFLPDGDLLLSGSVDKTLRLWDVATGRELRTFSGHEYGVLDVAVSFDGKLALSRCCMSTLKLWDIATGRELPTFSGYRYGSSSATFLPKGKQALSGCNDGTLKLWEVEGGQELRTFKGHTDWVPSVALSPDGMLALSGSQDKTMKLWDVGTGRELRTFKGHTDCVSRVAFSPDGELVLSGSVDKTLHLRDFTRPARYREFDVRLPKAREALQKNENDAEALKTFGEWYAFRGVNDWAVEFLEKARKNGVEVSPLILGRCYWLLSEDEHEPKDKRPAHRAAAAAEFQNEIARVKARPVPQDPKAKLAREQEELYLSLCLQAVSKPKEADKPAEGK